MSEEGDGAPSSPPSAKKLKMQSEDEQVFKDEDHSAEKEEFNEIEEDDDEDELRLFDMIDFPPLSTLPPTPPLPSSSPTGADLDMEQQDSDEDDGPPPGWDNNYQLKEQQEEQLETLAAASAVSSDMQTEDVRNDAHNEEGGPQSHAHPSLPPEVAPSGEEQDSEDDGPPPGWDFKCQHEPELQKAPQSDMKMEDVLQDAQNEGEGGQPTAGAPSVDQEDSEDEGPPPGWDSKCQPEPKVQNTPQSDSEDIKMNYVHQDAQNENDLQSQSQSQSRSSPTPGLVSSDVKVEEQDSEDDGPPPGWNSKCQLEPDLKMACPTTPPSDLLDFKIEDDKEGALDKEGSPTGWGFTPQQQSHVHSSLPSPIVQSDFKIEEDKEVALDKEGSPTGRGSTPQQQSCVHSSLPSPVVKSGVGTGYESNNAKNIEGSPQQLSRQLPVHPTKPQISVPKPPMTMNNPEMGQMVCGSCRHLLSYPRGARYVECACCLEENYVLEEHEVGQVVCGGCKVLLMYPYGAPKVRCANCRTETEVGDQNRRPPLSEHKRRARQHLKRVHAG